MRAKPPRISALIIAKNEAHNLPHCLATLGWADEVIVVVDQGSRDKTLEIAKRRATVALIRPFRNFATQRNAALAVAKGDWVFAIDADECVPSDLASEIRRVVADPNQPHNGYRVPIQSVILGRPFAFSGTQDDQPLRLFRRQQGHWVGAVHETVDLVGTVGALTCRLQHRTLPNLNVIVRKMNKYTTLEARDLLRQGQPARWSGWALRPFWTFLKRYIGKQGFRDGAEGFIFCLMAGVSEAARNWKHRELVQAQTRRRTNA